MSAKNSKSIYAKSKPSDKIAAILFFLLIATSIIVSAITERAFILTTPFIIYALWAIIARRVWLPAWFASVRGFVIPVIPRKYFWTGKEALHVGIWMLFVGVLLTFVLYIALPYQEDPSTGCEMLENHYAKDSCYNQLSQTYKTVSYCFNIENETMRKECEFNRFLQRSKE